MTRWTATGPALAGCHEIDPQVAARWLELGGEDIEVWGEDYVLWTKTDTALHYVVAELGLTNLTPAPLEG